MKQSLTVLSSIGGGRTPTSAHPSLDQRSYITTPAREDLKVNALNKKTEPQCECATRTPFFFTGTSAAAQQRSLPVFDRHI